MKKIKSELMKLKKNNVFNKKRIVAIGRIENVKYIQDILSSLGLKLDAIVDNDRKKQGLWINGVQVYSPNDYLIPYNNNIRIIIYSPKYWPEIQLQFERIGYKENENIIVLNKPTLKNNIQSIIKGQKLYVDLKKEFGSDVFIFTCSCPLGDFYLLGIYLKQYLEENNMKNYVIVGNSKGMSKISELFQFTNVKELKDEDTDLLVKLFAFLGKSLDLKILSIWQGALRFNSCLVRQRSGFTFMDTFKHFVYRLDNNIQPRIPQFEILDNGISGIFEKKCLLKGKTIILAPFSYSIQSLPIPFWEKLANKLNDRGYCVAVNIDEARESNLIYGTETLNIPLAKSVCAIEYAGVIIGIRSGFFDVTSSAKCKRVILYPQKLSEKTSDNWNSTDLEFNSLKSMGLCEDSIEIEFPLYNNELHYIKNGQYDEEQTDLLINDIIENI